MSPLTIKDYLAGWDHIDSGDINSNHLISILLQNPSLLVDLRSRLPHSVGLREAAPLLIDFLVDVVVDSLDNADNARIVLEYLPFCCRPKELHTFCLDAWIKLWSRKCNCVFPVAVECRLSLARSVICRMLVDVVRGAKKGNLYDNQENYLLSIGGQLLSKFLLPETVRPTHHLSSAWIDATLNLSAAVLEMGSLTPEDPLNQVHSEVALRLMSAIVECASARTVTWWGDLAALQSSFSGTITLIQKNESLLSTICAKMQISSGKSQSVPPTERSADFEIQAADVALILVAEQVLGISNPTIIPSIWSDMRRSEVLAVNALCLLNSSYIVPGLFLGMRALCENPSSVLPCQHGVRLVERMIDLSTSYGSEENIPITKRQEVYTLVVRVIAESKPDAAVRACTDIIEKSSSDSVVGIFVKLLKDVWVTNALSDDLFYRISRKLVSDDYQIVDGMDTLKSFLNWGRLVMLKNANSPEKESFKKKIQGLSRQVDLALAASDSVTTELQKTRIVFIGHLIARLREIIDHSCCH